MYTNALLNRRICQLRTNLANSEQNNDILSDDNLGDTLFQNGGLSKIRDRS